MLDYKILKLDHGISYGSTTLKSLQNDSIPELDLLVREAIQNSSDAALQVDDKKYRVNFQTGFFNPGEFNEYMTGLENTLNKMYPVEQASFLEIRDSRTSGLTGHIHKADIIDDDHGNFFKLIFDTGKKQTASGAGGNWGFGKSVYYRVGIGIVIFYSRVKVETGYESRLIITLVEDESKKNPDGSSATLLNPLEPAAVGKAWWGEEDGEDFLPITDENLINDILSVFELVPFNYNETGTSVIIPYVDREKLLEDIIPHEAELPDDTINSFKSVWGESIEDYLTLSIQKWYAPKIHNFKLNELCPGNKWLHVSVNGTAIRKDDMLPFFKLVQELYNISLSKINGTSYEPELNYVVTAKPINTRRDFAKGMTAGYVAVTKITKDQLFGNSMSLSPYVYCGLYTQGDHNEPMIMYTRDPGMIIEYTSSGPWVKGLPWIDNEDEYLFAFFMPDTKQRLRDDLAVKEHAGKTLGDYLRSCEASDHMGWSDPARMSIVSRIQTNTVKQISQIQNADAVHHDEATASRLSGKLGRLLLPKKGYGKKGRSGGGGNGGGTKLRDLEFEIISQRMRENVVEFDYKIKMSHARRTTDITVLIDSESGRIDPNAWENDIGTPYPITIQEVYIDTISSSEIGKVVVGKECNTDSISFSEDLIDASINKANDNDYSSFKITSHIVGAEVKGKLRLCAKDKRYSFSFKVV